MSENFTQPDQAELPSKIPSFLIELEGDHPELAQSIKGRINEWTDSVNKIMGRDDFAKTVLDNIDYVSRDEITQFISQVAAEVIDLIDSGVKEIIFFKHIDGDSRDWFYKILLEQIPKDKRDILKYRSSFYVRTYPDAHFFILDDSSNSGKQLEATVQTPFIQEKDHLSFTNQLRVLFLGKKTSLHIRLLRITEYAKNNLEKTASENKKSIVELDIQAKKMPTIKDVLNQLGMRFEDLNKEQQRLLKAHHEYHSPILGFFFHKLQDNLPTMLISGRLDDKDFQPLIGTQTNNDDVIKPPYRN
jgi:hypothetical protein